MPKGIVRQGDHLWEKNGGSFRYRWVGEILVDSFGGLVADIPSCSVILKSTKMNPLASF